MYQIYKNQMKQKLISSVNVGMSFFILAILCNKTIRDNKCYLKQSSVHPRKKSTIK